MIRGSKGLLKQDIEPAALDTSALCVAVRSGGDLTAVSFSDRTVRVYRTYGPVRSVFFDGMYWVCLYLNPCQRDFPHSGEPLGMEPQVPLF